MFLYIFYTFIDRRRKYIMSFKKRASKVIAFSLVGVILGTPIFNTAHAIEESKVSELQNEEYDLDEVEEYDLGELDYVKEGRVIPLIARLVLVGGKYVIKYGTKIYKAVSSTVAVNALKNYKTVSFTTGKFKFLLTKTDMNHMLTRHHPKFWVGGVKSKQTFYSPKLSINDVKNISLQIAKQNRNTLSSKGTNSTFQIKGKVNGVEYVMGVTKGHIKQLYPTK